LAPILSTDLCRDSRRAAGMWPGVIVIPERSVILCVCTLSFSLLNVPALVLSTRWKVYSESTAKPLSLVLCTSLGFGMLPALLPLRYSVRLRSSAVATSIGSHSRTTEVCVALRQRSSGADGVLWPKVRKISDWSS
jgi:hypothetical protein